MGVIGARRRRQGLGPFVVRDLVRAGAHVPCFLATSEKTRNETQERLARDQGIAARGYLDLEEMREAEQIDALAILSPAETHETYLEAAYRAGLHVLCEKPFVWQCDDLGVTGAGILDAFASRDLLVVENCPWPYTLPCFEALHPEFRSSRTHQANRAPERFDMFLQPSNGGLQMLCDSFPHAISLLQALIPDSPLALEAIEYEGNLETGPMTVRFRCISETSPTLVRVELEPTQALPRRAWIAIDGRRAERDVISDSYELSFSDAGRSVPVRDPLSLLVADFIDNLATPNAPRRERLRRTIARRIEMLQALLTHYRAAQS